jgi:hypothetical protein
VLRRVQRGARDVVLRLLLRRHRAAGQVQQYDVRVVLSAFAEQDGPLSPGDFIGKWMSLIEPAAAGLGPRSSMKLPEYLRALEQASSLRTLDNLMSFPFIAKRVAQGELQLEIHTKNRVSGTPWAGWHGISAITMD